MCMPLPSSFQGLLVKFTPVFTAPSMENFTFLVVGWILCSSRHSISRAIQFAFCRLEIRHHAALYRFFSRAIWPLEMLPAVLLQMALLFVPEGRLTFIVDDTLSRKSGPQIWGTAIHWDPLDSTYGRKGGKKKVTKFASGHNWVILSIWIPFPWNTDRGIALPISFRLYLSKKRTPKESYRKRTELAKEMFEQILSLLPPERTVLLLGDGEYSCRGMVLDLPQRVAFIGPMLMGAAFYGLTPPRTGKRGAPRKKGARLPSPAQLAADPGVPWKKQTLTINGKDVTYLAKTQVGLWYRVSGTRPVRMVVTRDPRGVLEGRAYFCTDSDWEAREIGQSYYCRWSCEVMHRNAKQHLGLGDPQNGWWRRPKGKRHDKSRVGYDQHKERGKKAAERTVPFILTAYSLVVLWYLRHGSPEEDVDRARRWAPWYRHKAEPSFADMLYSVRKELWGDPIFRKPASHRGCKENQPHPFDLLMTG